LGKIGSDIMKFLVLELHPSILICNIAANIDMFFTNKSLRKQRSEFIKKGDSLISGVELLIQGVLEVFFDFKLFF
jgi:hypothetical protein